MGRFEVDNIMTGFDNLKASYQLGEDSRHVPRLTAVNPTGSGADYHYINQRTFLYAIERAREFERSDPIVGQGIGRLCDNVLQDGIQADPATGDPQLDADLKARWLEFISDPWACDARGILTLDQMAKVGLRSMIRDGDVLFLPLQDPQEKGWGDSLQPIEAHRILSPSGIFNSIVHGVEIDRDTGRPIAYYVLPEPNNVTGGGPRLTDLKRRPAVDESGEPAAFHLYNPQRFSQTRGISAFNPVTHTIAGQGDLIFANLVRAKLAAFHALFRELPIDFAGAPNPAAGAQRTETQADGTDRFLEELAPGMIRTGRPGEKFNFQVANVPNPSFFEHTMLGFTIISVNLGLPLAVLLLDPTKTNFSGWRGAIDQARMGFRNLQTLMISQFYAPVYRWKILQWKAVDRAMRNLPEGSKTNVLGVKWRRPRSPYIQPEQDIKADALRIKEGLTSPQRCLAERGDDFEEITQERLANMEVLFDGAATVAERLNAKHPGMNVDWREVIHLGDQIPNAVTAVEVQQQDAGGTAARLAFEQEVAA